MVYVSGTGCMPNEWGLDQAKANAVEAAKLKACGCLYNIDSFVIVTESVPYSSGKNICIDITAEVVCKVPFERPSRRKSPAE